MLAKEGYISGVERIETFDTIGNGYPNIKLVGTEIELKGLEYLEETKEALKYNIELEFDTSSLDEVNKTIESMSEHLEKAMELAKSIAKMRLDLRFNVVIDDKTTELASISTE